MYSFVKVFLQCRKSVCRWMHVRTSLSSEASRWRERSDIRKLRVVSTIGWGPGFSGAYWTFRMTNRTEFLLERYNFSGQMRFHCKKNVHIKCIEIRYRLWVFSSTVLAQNALTSKSTPHAYKKTEINEHIYKKVFQCYINVQVCHYLSCVLWAWL